MFKHEGSVTDPNKVCNCIFTFNQYTYVLTFHVYVEHINSNFNTSE